MSVKCCTRCRQHMSLDNFSSKRGKAHGRAQCKACTYATEKVRRLRPSAHLKIGLNAKKNRAHKSDYQRTQRQLRKQALRELKTSPCADCGGTFDSVAMDFDHTNRNSKIANVAVLIQNSWGQAIEEVAKCDLVCANCHRLRTKSRARIRCLTIQCRYNKKIVDAVKELPCSDCKKQYDPCQMDFDHVHGSKVTDPSKLLGGSTDALLSELTKCQLRCANCHRIKTHRSNAVGVDYEHINEILRKFIAVRASLPIEQDLRQKTRADYPWVHSIGGLSAKEIAANAKVSLNTVYRIGRKFGFAPKRAAA